MQKNIWTFFLLPLVLLAKEAPQTVLEAGRPGNTWGFYASLEYLYWKTFQSDTEYAYSYSPPLLNGESKEVDFDFDSGIRPGIGVTIPYDNWDLHLFYTYFRNSEKEDCEDNLFPLLAAQSLFQTTIVSRAKIDVLLRFQMLDFEISRPSYLSEAMLFRPFFGPRVGWVDQELDLTYFSANSYKIAIDNAFWGGGVRLGSELTAMLGKGFFLNGQMAFSALWGDLDIRQKHYLAESKVIDLRKKCNRMVPLVDLQGGIGWGIWFNANRNHFAITFDYEMQYLWNITQYARFPENSNLNTTRAGKDIGIHGATIKGRMDF
ncbi:MAG: hypothetical protein ChlgKO_02420 [Chlamydiales bacterium]